MKTVYHIISLESFKFISENDFHLIPKIPGNPARREDTRIERISVGISIENCLMAREGIYTKPKFRENYLILRSNNYLCEILIEDEKLYKPSIKDVPDIKLSKEFWILNKVRIRSYRKIYIDYFDNKITWNFGNDGQVIVK